MLTIAVASDSIEEYLTLRDGGFNDEDVIEYMQMKKAISLADKINTELNK